MDFQCKYAILIKSNKKANSNLYKVYQHNLLKRFLNISKILVLTKLCIALEHPRRTCLELRLIEAEDPVFKPREQCNSTREQFTRPVNSCGTNPDRLLIGKNEN